MTADEIAFPTPEVVLWVAESHAQADFDLSVKLAECQRALTHAEQRTRDLEAALVHVAEYAEMMAAKHPELDHTIDLPGMAGEARAAIEKETT